MIRKTAVIVLVAMIVSGTAAALNANVQPSSPDDIVLKNSNNYEVTRTYDGSASSGDIKGYNWNLVGESQSDSGVEAEFDFVRGDASPSNTVRLTVSDGNGNSDVDEVTQIIRDKPNLSISGDESIDFADIDGEETYTSTVDNEYDNPISYTWKVDGSQESTGSSFTYDFDDTGDYTVKLEVEDDAGHSNSDSLSVSVENTTEENNNDQQGNNGGNQDQEIFTEARAWNSFTSGESETAEFDNSPVTEVEITASNDVSGPELASRTQDTLPDEADSEPSGSVFEYVELKKTNFTNDDIDSVNFDFKVEKDWVENNDIKEDSIRLQRYNDGSWDKLDSSKESEDSDNIYFSASSPGLSVFSVTGEQAEPDIQVTNLELSSSEIDPNQTADIDVVVENQGDKEGDYSLEFELDGEQFEEEINDLGSGEKVTVTFTKNFTEEGDYQIDVEGQSASITVGNPVESLETESVNQTNSTNQTSVEDDQSEGGLPIIAISLLVVLIGVVVAVAAFFFTHEEKRDEAIEEIEEIIDGVKEKMGSETEDEEGFEWDGFENN